MEDLVSWWCLEEWIISCMQVCFCYIEGYDLTIVCFGTCWCVALWSFFVLIMLGSASFHSFVICKVCFLGWFGDLDSMGLGYVHFIITVGIFLSGWLFCNFRFTLCDIYYVWKTTNNKLPQHNAKAIDIYLPCGCRIYAKSSPCSHHHTTLTQLQHKTDMSLLIP